MAIFSRKRKHPQDQGLSRFKAGLIAIVVLVVATYFGFTKWNPFANPYELKAMFRSATNVKPRSPVRIAGVDVGEVKKVEARQEDGAALVTMEIKDKGQPIHEDAQLQVRTRIFLEGNVFLDLRPGTPSAGTVDSGGTIPVQQTSTPVQLGEVLAVLQRDIRGDLRILLDEYGRKGLGGGGAQAFNRAIPYGEPAFKYTALASDATLGEEPTKDIPRVLRGQARVFRALARNPEALKGLVTNLNITAGALAREDQALGATVPALRDTLRAANPALASLNSALPSVRSFAVDALPGVRSSGPTIKASLPFIHQARLLVRPSELQGLAKDLSAAIPDLAKLNHQAIPFLDQTREISSCQNEVLLPFVNSEIPEPGVSGDQTNQKVIQQLQRSFPGLSGESRTSDANGSFFHGSVTLPTSVNQNVRPAPPLDGGLVPPPHRPNVPCETQEPPNLNAPGGAVSVYGQNSVDRPANRSRPASNAEKQKALRTLERYLTDKKFQRSQQLDAAKRVGRAKKREKP